MGYYPTAQNDFFLFFMGLLPIVLWLFMLAASVVIYILRSFGLYKMAKNTAMPNPLLAFVPVIHEYLAAKMADRGNAAYGKKTKYGQWVLISSVVMLAVAGCIFVHLFLAIFGEALLSTSSMDLITILPMLLFLLYYMLFLLSCLVVKIFQVISLYYLYRDFEPESAVIYTVLSVFGLDIICKLLLKDNVPVSIAGRYPIRQPKYRA